MELSLTQSYSYYSFYEIIYRRIFLCKILFSRVQLPNNFDHTWSPNCVTIIDFLHPRFPNSVTTIFFLLSCSTDFVTTSHCPHISLCTHFAATTFHCDHTSPWPLFNFEHISLCPHFSKITTLPCPTSWSEFCDQGSVLSHCSPAVRILWPRISFMGHHLHSNLINYYEWAATSNRVSMPLALYVLFPSASA